MTKLHVDRFSGTRLRRIETSCAVVLAAYVCSQTTCTWRRSKQRFLPPPNSLVSSRGDMMEDQAGYSRSCRDRSWAGTVSPGSQASRGVCRSEFVSTTAIPSPKVIHTANKNRTISPWHGQVGKGGVAAPKNAVG